MNEQLSNALAEVLKSSKDGVVSIALYAQQQAPELAKQIVAWGLAVSIFWSIAIPAIIFAIWKVCERIRRQIKLSGNYDGSEFLIPYSIIGGVITAILIIVWFCELQQIIQCVVAPKLYLIDYIKEFIKK